MYQHDVTQSMPLTPIEQAKSRIRNNVLTSDFVGWTNIPAALDSALNLFTQGTSSNKKVAILFTDGKVELPNATAITNRQGEKRCREIAQAFKDAGIPLYTVGLNFNGGCDIAFLQELSDIASPIGMAARSYEAKTNWDIPEIFSKIYINIFNGNADVGLQFDSVDRTQTAVFYADEGIYELNVLLMHNQRLDNLVIRHPNGQVYQDATFTQRDPYSYVKIRYPDVGDWEFSFQGDIILANKLVSYVEGNVIGNVTITFNVDGGNSLNDVQIPVGSMLQDVPVPTKTGFVFDGWYLNEARTRPLPEGRRFTTNTILYAKWMTPPLHNITIMGDSVTAHTYKAPEGDRLYNHMPDAPSLRKGYTFLGWYREDGTALDENIMISQNITLVARWDKIDVNLIPSIILLILSIGIFITGWIYCKKMFYDSYEKSERFCAGIAALFSIAFGLTLWTILKAYIYPIEIMSSLPKKDAVGSFTFSGSLSMFSFVGGFLFPIILNTMLSAVLPLFFVAPARKERQYLVHFIISFVGILWPLALWIMYGLGWSMLWIVGYSLIAFTLNFFLSALLFRRGKSKKCSRFFFDV